MEPIETLLHEMSASNVDKVILAQLRNDFDNSYLIECTRRFHGQCFAVVGIDPQHATPGEALSDLISQGAVGVRLGAEDRSPGADPFEIWSATSELGVPASVLGSLEQFAAPAFKQLVEKFPRIRIILEHLGGVGPYWGPTRPEKTIAGSLFAEVLSLANYPNIYMKVPGLGEFMPRPTPMCNPPFQNVEPLIEMAVHAFGSSRLMWGSDFPPSAAREGYANALRYPRETVKFKSETDRDWAFGGTARLVFNIGK